MKKILILCAACGLLFASLALETAAEVRVHTRADGAYEAVTMVPGGPPWSRGIWSGTRGRLGLRRTSTVLNPMGDRIGDLVPTIVESGRAPHHPWAVWSRFNGNDYDLVYASWDYSWSRIAPVVRESIHGDDLDPSLAFDRFGNPLLAWWNRDPDDGRGTVYVSRFENHEWTEPQQISDDALGGRYPTIMIARGSIVVEYESDDGSSRLVYELPFFDPTTITDDIDPQTSFGGETELVKDTSDKH